jgi:diguanylate cyclase (GGDEF)-like protein
MSVIRRILVVDPSKLVRAALAKNLKDTYLIREESDGELAWQTLILDSSIAAVISGVNLPKLDAYGLLERLRGNKLRRLQELPVLLLVSGAENDAEHLLAKERGVGGFITKAMSRTEMLAKVAQLIHRLDNVAGDDEASADEQMLTATDVCGSAMVEQAAEWPELETPPPAPEEVIFKPLSELASTHLLSADEIKANIEQALAGGFVRGTAVSVICFGVDNEPALADEYGSDMVRRVGIKIAKLLRSKVSPMDSVGQLRPGCLTIVASGSDLEACVKFAERVCRGMANAQIGSDGTRFPISVSAGIASTPQDGDLNAGNLLLLAHRRLCEAIENGGNQVQAKGRGQPQLVPDAEMLVARVLASFRFNQAEDASACLATAGLQIMPLLKALDHEFGFALPLADMEAQLEQQALTESLKFPREHRGSAPRRGL